MKRGFLTLLAAAALLAPASEAAVSEANFEAEQARDLLALCGVAADDPRAEEAIHFCHGYLVGAYDFHIADTAGPQGVRMVCLPTGPQTLSRDAVVRRFVAWLREHPEYHDESAVDGWARFLVETFPCPGQG